MTSGWTSGWRRLAFVGALAAGLAGCGDDSAPPSTAPSSSGATAAVQAERGKDAELTARVEEALAAEGVLKEDVEVQSNDGVVVLKGRVETDEDKKRVTAAVQKVEGVKYVQNQVAVTPPPAPAPGEAKAPGEGK